MYDDEEESEEPEDDDEIFANTSDWITRGFQVLINHSCIVPVNRVLYFGHHMVGGILLKVSSQSHRCFSKSIYSTSIKISYKDISSISSEGAKALNQFFCIQVLSLSGSLSH